MIKNVLGGCLVARVLLFTRVCAADFSAVQEEQIEKLEVVGEKVVALLDQLDEKIVDLEISSQLIEKQEEINVLITQQQEAIERVETTQEIRDILEETKNRIVLKTYDGITHRDPLTETVKVSGGKREQEKAVQSVLDIMDKGTRIQIQIITSKPLQDVFTELYAIDETVQVNELFVDGVTRYLEISFDKNGLLYEELFRDVEAGVLPQKVIHYKVVQPEVYTIGTLLSGEQSAQLWGQRLWKSAEYHDFLRLGKKVRVAVIDTGIDKTHPDLASVVSSTISGYDFVNDDGDPSDDHLHGTHVAGTIAAVVNGQGVYGVNPFVEIVPLKICTAQGYCPSYAITNALRYAADHGVEVLNMSLGGFGSLLNNPTCAAIEYATQKGSIAVVAAGNANTNVLQSIPGACPYTITVGAVDQNLVRAPFSNYGEQVDISAPGVGIYSTVPGGGRKKLDGTSMATPHVSAAVAALLSKTESRGRSVVQDRLLSSTVPVSYEPGKVIGPFLDYPSLMESLGGVQITGTQNIPLSGAETLSGGEELLIQQLQEFTSSHQKLDVKTGETVLVTVSHGTPPYRISKENDTVGFAQKDATTKNGVQIASVAVEAVFESIGETIFSGDEYVYEGDFSSEETEKIVTHSKLGGDVDALAVASSSQQYSFRLLGLTPGKNKVTVTDALGKKAEIEVTVRQQIQLLRKNWYGTLADNDVYSFFRVESGTPSNIAVRKSNPRVGYPIYVQTQNTLGIADLTFSIYNKHELKYQQLALTLFVGSDLEYREYLAARFGSGEDTNPIKVNEQVELVVGEEKTILLSGGRPGYTYTIFSGEQYVGLGNVTGSVVSESSLRLLGLQPGEMQLVVKDMFGRQKQVSVRVKESVVRIKPGDTRSLGGRSAWRDTKQLVPNELVTTKLGYQGRRDVRAGVQEGLATLSHHIYNKEQQRDQIMLYSLRVGHTLAVEPLETSIENVTLEVGKIVLLQISGGTPQYKIKKSNQNVGLGRVQGAGALQIASAGSFQGEEQVVLEQMGDREEVVPPSEIPEEGHEQIASVDLVNIELPQNIQIAGYEQEKYSMYLFGLQPGETELLVTDHEGTQKSVYITVKETVLTGSLGMEKGWYYQMHNIPWRVTNISSDHPTIVSTVYSSRTYIYKLLRDGITALTLQIRNEFENKYQTMRYTVRSGMPSTMEVSVSTGIVAVGETTLVTIQGGGGPYTITKSNELIGLGYEQGDMTTIAGADEKKKILFPDGQTQPPEVFSTTGETNLTNEQVTLLDEKESSLLSGETAIASTDIGTNKQVFRVVGLQPGESTLTVSDVYGEQKTVTVTVIPSHLHLTSAYVSGQYRRPLDTNLFLRFMLPKPIYNGLQRASTQRWIVGSVGIENENIVGNGQYGHARTHYLFGVSNGTTSLTVDIYNPDERKNQTMMYTVTTTGMTYTELQERLARYEREREANSGQASSINPGGGGFPVEGVQTSPVIEILEEKMTILGKIVQIRVVGGSGKYELTVDKDVHIIDGSLRIAQVDSLDTADGEILLSDDDTLSEDSSVAAVTVSETYTIPIEASKTYSLMVPNTSTIQVKNTTKNTVTTKQISSHTTFSDFVYTAVKGTSLDMPVNMSYVVASDNNTIMSVLRKTTGGYRVLFNTIGSTKLKVYYTNLYTGRKTQVAIDVNVVEKSSGSQVIEKTVYLEENKKYELFLGMSGDYKILYSNNLLFSSMDGANLFTTNNNIQTAGYSEFMEAIMKYNTFNNLNGIIINPLLAGEYKIKLYLQDSKKELLLTLKVGGIAALDKVFNVYDAIYICDATYNNIEDFIAYTFVKAGIAVNENDLFKNGYSFYRKFGTSGERNLKLHLIDQGFISEENTNILFQQESVSPSDLGNLLYGYLAGVAGIYNFAVDYALQIEKENYIPYYGPVNGLKRAVDDENSDIPWYVLGNSMSNKSIDYYGMKSEITQNIKRGKIDSAPYILAEENNLTTICNETKGKYVQCLSLVCKSKDPGFYILNSNGEKLYDNNCK